MNRLKQIIGCILLLLLAGCEKDTEPTNFAPKLSTGRRRKFIASELRYLEVYRSQKVFLLKSAVSSILLYRAWLSMRGRKYL